ncbi:hypothetical protein MOQ72_37235 [Saccharopolyspora sp. K220]|uniref:scabin-related ADP-ribosyltransferase n=1 Tax=Saccharopolyspora soli TaxID=2926618 RepID=UPI001F56343C|nr:hypothetical protein [Saccharopolyspora soli]MCI2423077.1 hypothetical protein [Saccharopolyspora soli]
MAWDNTTSLGNDLAHIGDELSFLGAAVGIGDDVIPGDVDTAHTLAEHLLAMGAAYDHAAGGFAQQLGDGWSGAAADAARDKLHTAAPHAYRAAADAHTAAGGAVKDYARVLADAKATAAAAHADLQRANAHTEQARRLHQAQGNPLPFQDPAAGRRAAAEKAIAAARGAVDDADHRATRIILAALEHAPQQPNWLARADANLTDMGQGLLAGVGDVGIGLVNGIKSIGIGVWNLGSALSTWGNLSWLATHPDEVQRASDQTIAMATRAWNNPLDTGWSLLKTTVDAKGWADNPLRAAGEALPGTAATVLGGSGIAARIAQRFGGGTGNLSDGVKHLDPPAPPRAEPGIPRPPAPETGHPPTPHPEPTPLDAEASTPRPDDGFGPKPPEPDTHHSSSAPEQYQPRPRPEPTWADYRPGDDVYERQRDPNHPEVDEDQHDEPTPRRDPAGSPAEHVPQPQQEPPHSPLGSADEMRLDHDGTPPEQHAAPPDIDAPNHTPRPDAVENMEDDLDNTAAEPIAAEDLPDDAVWRTTNEPLYRSDQRHWDDVFSDGFSPPGNDISDLRGHVDGHKTSGYVSTTTNPDHFQHANKRFFYEIDAPGGVDINQSLGSHQFEWESEIAAPGGIVPERIRGGWAVVYDDTGAPLLTHWVDNPNYVPLT